MSIHKSLRTGGSLMKHRNVFSRVERIKILEESGRWLEGRNNVLGLVKVKNIKVVAKKKAKKDVAAEGVGAASITPGAIAAVGAGPAGSAGAKSTAPAASAAKSAGKK
ncbi:MAG: small basic protein [Planctomycetota bacterium]